LGNIQLPAAFGHPAARSGWFAHRVAKVLRPMV